MHITNNNTYTHIRTDGVNQEGIGGVGDVGKEQHKKEKDKKRGSTAQSSVPSSLDEEMEDSLPLLFLVSLIPDLTGSNQLSCRQNKANV